MRDANGCALRPSPPHTPSTRPRRQAPTSPHAARGGIRRGRRERGRKSARGVGVHHTIKGALPPTPRPPPLHTPAPRSWPSAPCGTNAQRRTRGWPRRCTGREGGGGGKGGQREGQRELGARFLPPLYRGGGEGGRGGSPGMRSPADPSRARRALQKEAGAEEIYGVSRGEVAGNRGTASVRRRRDGDGRERHVASLCTVQRIPTALPTEATSPAGDAPLQVNQERR